MTGDRNRLRADVTSGARICATALAKDEFNFAYVSGMSPDGDHLQAIVFGPIAPRSRALDRRFYEDR
jgi:hypothetical protein